MAIIQQTRAQIRRRIADMFGDLRMLTATGNGSTTTFVDTFNVNTGTDDYRKAEIFFTSGSNNGLTSVIASLVQSTGTLTFTPARTSTATSDTAELYRMKGTGFQVTEYHRAINDAIADLHGAYLVKSLQSVATAYDAETQTFTVPTTMHKAYMVEYQDDDDFWQEIPPADRKGVRGGWTAEPESGVVRIEGPIAWAADTHDLRVHGYIIQQPLTADTDYCYYDAEAVAYKAAMKLCMGRIGGPEAKFGQMYLTLEKNAMKAIAMNPTVEHPQTRVVRV